ncbi:MAG: glycerophosphodiester phosphodiesterase family protein [Candidatus Sigynarchaeota archaeon]
MARQGIPDGTTRPALAIAWLAVCTISIADIGFVFVVLLILQPYLYDLNVLLGNVIGLRINYMLFFAILAGLLITWFFILIVRYKRQLSRNAISFKICRVEIAISIVILVAWNVFYIIFGSMAGGEIFIVVRFLDGISFYLYIALNVLMVACLFKAIPAILRMVKRVRKLTGKARYANIIALSTMLAIYTACFALPFVLTPTTISSDPLPPKPRLIGHRGASNYAPENTIRAAQESLQFGVAGWEVDVQVSFDGVFFLMHDDDLRRTTDVETVYPNLASVPACMFNFSQIRALDAGSWFADDDPYGTILSGIVPRSQAESYRGVKVPSLQDAINFSETHDLILEIDFKSPPLGHPFHDTARSSMIAMLGASSLGKKAWVYTASASAENLSRLCTRSCSVESVIAKGYDAVNLDLDVPNARLAEYRAHGIPTILYTVDSVEIYSTLWTLGVMYVKTNRPWLFTGLDQPVPRMTHAQYAAFWLAFFAAGIAAVIFALILRQKGIVPRKKDENEEEKRKANHTDTPTSKPMP